MQIPLILVLALLAVVATTHAIPNDTIASTHQSTTLHKRNDLQFTGTLPGLFYIGVGNNFMIDRRPILIPSVYYPYSLSDEGLKKRDGPVKAAYGRGQIIPFESSGLIYIPYEFIHGIQHPYEVFQAPEDGHESKDNDEYEPKYKRRKYERKGGVVLNQVTILTDKTPAIQVETGDIDLRQLNSIILEGHLQMNQLSDLFHVGYKPILKNIEGTFTLCLE